MFVYCSFMEKFWIKLMSFFDFRLYLKLHLIQLLKHTQSHKNTKIVYILPAIIFITFKFNLNISNHCTS